MINLFAFKKILRNKEFNNASWLVLGRIVQMLISLVVGLLCARYLGPSNYGTINYGIAYAGFFGALGQLGINSVIIKNFVDHPEERGETIGTALGVRAAASFLCFVLITASAMILDAGEPVTIIVVAFSGLSLLFHIFDTFNYWFQNRYQSKVVAISTLLAYVLTALYKVVLLILNKNVLWFAFSTCFDYIVYGVIIYIFYRKNDGPSLSFSLRKAKQLLSVSYHYILSGLMVAVFLYAGNVMLKQLMDETNVGYYSTAIAVCGMWVFVLQAIVDSMYPTILQLHQKSREAFEKKNKQLYAIVFYASAFVSLIFTLFGGFVVELLYGEAYAPASLPLRIVTWYTAFSYLGVARNAWLVCENKQKYLKYIYAAAAVVAVVLNYLLISWQGLVGAALAALIIQMLTSIIIPAMFKGMRRNCRLMIEAILLRGVK